MLIVNLPDPETALKLWAAGFGIFASVCLLSFQITESLKQKQRRRRKLALAETYKRELGRQS